MASTELLGLGSELIRRLAVKRLRGRCLKFLPPSRPRSSCEFVHVPRRFGGGVLKVKRSVKSDALWPWGQCSPTAEYGEFCRISGEALDREACEQFASIFSKRIFGMDAKMLSRGGGVHGDSVSIVLKRPGPSAVSDPLRNVASLGWKALGHAMSSYVPSPEFGTDCI